MALAMVLTLGLAIPAFAAAEEPKKTKRLVQVECYFDGELSRQDTLSYEGDSLFPSEMAVDNINDEEIADCQYFFDYDESGRYVHNENNFAGIDGGIDLVYDEEGNLLGFSSYGSGGAVEGTYLYENGRLISSSMTSSAMGPEPYYEVQYVYDADGIRTGATGKNTAAGFTFEESYEYDEQGRMVSMSSSRDGGEPTTCPYIYVPGLVIEAGSYMRVINLVDNAKIENYGWQAIAKWSITTDSQVNYICDDNGYLIKVDDGAGNYIELTYEPVA